MKSFKYTDKKNMLLSLVALILVVCMLTTITYSWIDSISTISVSSENDKLTIDSTTDSVIEVGSGGAEIDLGSYFNKSGNMHLTSCSSDGKDFYFRNIGTGNGFRLGTANDVNVNYISCTFQIKSVGDTVYYFNDTPSLKIVDGSTTKDISSYLKCAITVDNETLVVTGGATDATYYHINDVSGSSKQIKVKSASFYKWVKTTADKDDYLFFINAGDTKTVNIKLWLQDHSGEFTASNKKLNLEMSLMAAENKQVVYFKDASFSASGANKILGGFGSSDKDSLKMYLASDVTKNWSFSKVDGEDDVFMAELPLSYRMQEVYIVRSDNSNTGTLTPDKGDPIGCDYYWKTAIPDAEGLPVTFSVLGSSIYNSGVNATNTGIWKDTEIIYADDQYGLDLSTVTMNLVNNDTGSTDTMYYNTAKGYWEGYVVKDSKKLQFTAKEGSKTVGNWGNHADSKTQVRTSTDNVLNSMYIIYDLDKVGTVTNIGSWNTYNYWKEQISSYVLEGDFNDGKGTPMLYNDKAGKVSYAFVEVPNGSYKFKIYSTNSTKKYGSSTTLSFGSSATVSRSATLTDGGGEVTVTVNDADGGALLFTFDSDTHQVNVQFTPAIPSSEDVRSYVMVKTSVGTNWLKEINHWDTTYPHRTTTKVGDYNLNNNMYTVSSGAWSYGSGSWSYYEDESNTGNSLYLKPNSNWKSDGARFAAYFFGAGDKWVDMTDTDGDGIYKCEIPGDYPSVIFARMNPGTTANNFNDGVRWNQTNDLSLNSRGSSAYELFYVNMSTKATKMQFVNANRANSYPSGGYSMGTPVNGAMYYLNSSSSAGTIKANLQKAPTLSASANVSVNAKTTLTASGSKTGTAFKGANYSYYVKNTDTGTVRMVPAAWTPLYAGNYSATARANDGYITTAESAAKSITVK